MPTFLHGKDTQIIVNGVDLTSFFTSVNLSLESPALDVSTFGQTPKAFIPGLVFSGTVSLDGLWSGAANDAEDMLRTAFLAGNTAYLSYLTGSGAAGYHGYYLPVKRTGHAVTSSITDAVRISVDNQITGAPLMGISLGALAQRTNASQTFAGVDLGAGYAGTLAAGAIQVTQFTAGDSSITVTIETADDSGFSSGLATIVTFTATAVGAYSVAESAQTVKRYVRLKAACSAGETITLQGLLQAR